MNYKAWIRKSAKQPMAFESVEPGQLGSEASAILGHEAVDRVAAVGVVYTTLRRST